MIRRMICIQLCMLLSFYNQTATGGGRDSSGIVRHQKIMIIPYEPHMHLSDADMDLSRYSEKTPQEVRTKLRDGVTENLNAKLLGSFNTHSLLHDLRAESRQELNRIYAAIDYSYDTSFAILHPKPDSATQKGKWSENKARKKELEKRTASGDVRYMNVKVVDPKLLDNLNSKYGADLFIFLTQIEIKTNSKDCF